MRDMWHSPHHDGSLVHSTGEGFHVRLLLPHGHTSCAQVRVRWLSEGEARARVCELVETDDQGAWWVGVIPRGSRLVTYRFELDCDGSTSYLSGRGVFQREPLTADDFRLWDGYESNPGWIRDAVFYQVFLDRFAASTREARERWYADVPTEWPASVRYFAGGDLPGLRERLDYVRALGADTLLLTPFFPSPESHRYAAESFEVVDDRLGGDRALVELVTAAHATGMRVIGDLTLNHCGSGHPWFRAAADDPGAVTREFFYLQPDGSYACFQGVESLPKFDYRSDELLDRLVRRRGSVLRRWLEPPYALDGWRIDVAAMVGRHRHIDLNQHIACEVREAMQASSADSVVLAEVPHDPSQDVGPRGWSGGLLDAAFCSPVRRWFRPGSDLPTHELQQSLQDAWASLGWDALTSSVAHLGTHDHGRLASELASEQVEAAFFLLFTTPAAPMVFAGDELGLLGEDADAARRTMPWRNIDASGTSGSIGMVQQLAALRRALPALRRGGLRWLLAGPDVLVFERAAPDQRLLCAVSRSACQVQIPEASAFRATRSAPLDSRRSHLSVDTIGFSGAGWALWEAGR